MPVLKLTDSMMDIITKMSGGNPGALTVVMDLSNKAKEIDPDSADPFLLTLMLLDDRDIRGTDLYVLWNDNCFRDTRKFLVLVRAHQFGFLTKERFLRAAKDQTRTHVFSEEEITDLDAKVCEALPNFRRSQFANSEAI